MTDPAGLYIENEQLKCKLNILATQYKDLEHKNRLLTMALRAANQGNDTDDLRYSYEPGSGVE
jgi:hypothetical protein